MLDLRAIGGVKPADLGLGEFPFIPENALPPSEERSPAAFDVQEAAYTTNVTRHGYSLRKAMDLVAHNLRARQAECLADSSCRTYPQLMCKMNNHRWEQSDDTLGTSGGYHERFHAPHCGRYAHGVSN